MANALSFQPISVQMFTRPNVDESARTFDSSNRRVHTRRSHPLVQARNHAHTMSLSLALDRLRATNDVNAYHRIASS